jgi:putative membrane-bound dehydrogenase-like protein
LPEGFTATLFAGEPDVVQPIAFAIDPRGRLWVAECYSYPEWSRDGTGRDRILIFEDADGDGRFDKRTVFWDKGSNVSGLEVGFGGVWVCATPNFLFIPDRDGDDRPDGEPEVVLDGWSLDAQHNVFNGLTWGPDGWLYGLNGILATSKIGKPGTPEAERTPINCGVWRYHPTRRAFEAVASGTTNPWGLDFDDHGEMFITNCVIPHLYHVVPGAHYERMYGQDLNPHVYELLKTCADHVHWDTSENWYDIRRRGVTTTTDRAGGGHAHVGAMVYLGDNWPDAYRGSVFTCNVHGHRVNHDSLRRAGSSYVASHRKDFLLANDDWFRGLELQYGPDGAVYVTDWSDTGECHESDADGAHRENGRILKVAYGTPKPVSVDLPRLDSAELARLQLHKNDWYVRTARRLLQERAAAGADLSPAHRVLGEILRENDDPTRRLRALWALRVSGGLDDAGLRALLDDRDESVRSWAVRLLGDAASPETPLLEKFAAMASNDPSPRVRLSLASVLQRLPRDRRWPIARALAGRGEDAADAMLPLMIWYGVEPSARDNPGGAVELASGSRIPTLRRFLVRRAVELTPDASLAALATILTRPAESASRLDWLEGALEALRGRREVPAPGGWAAASDAVAADPDPDVRERGLRLAARFGDEKAFAALRALLRDKSADPDRRRRALEALTARRLPGLEADLHALLRGGELLGPAIRSLASFDDPTTPRVLLERYPRLDGAAKADAIETLATRPAWAKAMLEAVGSGVIPRRDVSATVARQLLAFRDPELAQLLERTWGTTRPTSQDKAALMERYRGSLTPEALSAADTSRGRLTFEQTCAQCHKIYGEGGDVGPELTGSDRANLAYVLENVLDPSASVGRDFKVVVVATADGRLLSGIVREQDEQAVVLQTANERIVLPRADIDEMRPSEESMMPEGLFEKLSPDEVRDLVAYLASQGQVPRPGERKPE